MIRPYMTAFCLSHDQATYDSLSCQKWSALANSNPQSTTELPCWFQNHFFCYLRMSKLSLESEWVAWMQHFATLSIKCVIQMCPSDVSYKCVHQMCHTNVSIKCVIQMCPSNLSYKCVHQMCHTNVSIKCVIQKTMCYLNLELSFTPQRELGWRSMYHTNSATAGIRTCDSQMRHSARTSSFPSSKYYRTRFCGFQNYLFWSKNEWFEFGGWMGFLNPTLWVKLTRIFF